MDYKNILLLVTSLVCTGCVSSHINEQNTYAQGYRTAVKHQMDQVIGDFNGGTFPYYHWNAPIVQELNVPAHINNGAFIPEHKELVLIKPGQWAKEQAYPISQQKEQYAQTNDNRYGHDITDITSVPKSMVSSGNAKP